MAEITYHREGDYLIPDLTAPEEPNIGVWGRRRKEFLRMNRNQIYLSFRKVPSSFLRHR